MLKPRFGAGAQATFLLRSAAQLAEGAGLESALVGAGEMVLQPYVCGLAASVAFLVGEGGSVPLTPAWQCLSTERVGRDVDRYHYNGGLIPLPRDVVGRATPLARQAVASVPGLRGYVGVDLVLSGAKDGSGDRAIEINPRLTTSYVGLRALAKSNLAEALLRVVAGEKGVDVRWESQHALFRADGTVEKFGPLRY